MKPTSLNMETSVKTSMRVIKKVASRGSEVLANTVSVSFPCLFKIKYSVKWKRVNMRTAGYLLDLTSLPPAPRSRPGAVLQASFALCIGIQAARGDADSYLAFYLNAFKRTSSKDVREQRVEQIADGVETQCSHRGGDANVHHSWW